MSFDETVDLLLEKMPDDFRAAIASTPFTPFAAMLLCRNMTEHNLDVFNKDMSASMPRVGQAGHVATEVKELYEAFQNRQRRIYEIETSQKEYLAEMEWDKNAEEFIERFTKKELSFGVFIKELIMYYYNCYAKCGRLLAQKTETLHKRENAPPVVTELFFDEVITDFEKATKDYLKDAEVCFKNLCLECFEFVRMKPDITDRAAMVKLFLGWKQKFKSFNVTVPKVNGVRKTYFDEYMECVDSITRIGDTTTYDFKRMDKEKDEYVTDEYDAEAFPDHYKFLALAHKRLARLMFEDLKVMYRDLIPHVHSLATMQKKIQKAQIATMRLDHKLIRQIHLHNNTSIEGCIPSYPVFELERDNVMKDVFENRTNRKIEKMYERVPIKDDKTKKFYDELKKNCYKEEMEEFEKIDAGHRATRNNQVDIAMEMADQARDFFNKFHAANIARKQKKKAEQQ